MKNESFQDLAIFICIFAVIAMADASPMLMFLVALYFVIGIDVNFKTIVITKKSLSPVMRFTTEDDEKEEEKEREKKNGRRRRI